MTWPPSLNETHAEEVVETLDADECWRLLAGSA